MFSIYRATQPSAADPPPSNASKKNSLCRRVHKAKALTSAFLTAGCVYGYAVRCWRVMPMHLVYACTAILLLWHTNTVGTPCACSWSCIKGY